MLMHSIVWQYLPVATQKRITAAMKAAGKGAARDRVLAWISVETNRKTFSHESKVRYWPGGEGAVILGYSHAHGAWMKWFDEP